ncbi:hypothetical protein SAY87_002529 [Trapa incisa]|uniref:RING-type E3 ubiquitin transferase n=2 Tax=Trapa TaxID=22665 RepID=A0AAN7KA48_TRANT|nr:hypothetical protein SAY87_002529 [Trapa incisa]KAK4764938.1 hypothetical protein SAY86_026028 [Trapa natans]
MGTTGNPNRWPPYNAYKDCSLGICTVYCPQWCYIIFPPPPPSSYGDLHVNYFSPLVIAVIGILASAFLLVIYYTLVTKYCRRRRRSRQGGGGDGHRVSDLNGANETEGQIGGGGGGGGGRAAGLEESAIKSITVYRYRVRDGLVEETDCSVCLSEFEEEESLRLLPKCNHAFHLPCIDRWLKSNASCPLCRSIISSSPMPPPTATPLRREVPPPPPPQSLAAAAAHHRQLATGDAVRVSTHAYCRTADAAAAAVVILLDDRRLSVQEEAVVDLFCDELGRTSVLLG